MNTNNIGKIYICKNFYMNTSIEILVDDALAIIEKIHQTIVNKKIKPEDEEFFKNTLKLIQSTKTTCSNVQSLLKREMVCDEEAARNIQMGYNSLKKCLLYIERC